MTRINDPSVVLILNYRRINNPLVLLQ